MTGRPGNPRTRVQFLHPPLIFKVNGIGFFIHFTSVSFSLNKSVATHVYLFHLLGQGRKRWRESLFITPLKVGWLSLPFPLRTHIHRTKTLKISFELGLTYIKAKLSFLLTCSTVLVFDSMFQFRAGNNLLNPVFLLNFRKLIETKTHARW